MRAGRSLLLGWVIGAMLLAGCAGEPDGPTSGSTDPQTTEPAAAAQYGEAEMKAAALSLDDPSLAGFHPFTFPEPDPNDPPETDQCAVKWSERFEDHGETATFDTDQVTYAENDSVGPFVFQQQTIQPGAGAADVVAAARTSYLGNCAKWTSAKGFTFEASEQKDVGTWGDESFGYRVMISDGEVDIEVMGIYMSKANLLSHVEYAASPSISATAARNILIAAGRLLPGA
jgi:hypothetical protein